MNLNHYSTKNLINLNIYKKPTDCFELLLVYFV